MKQRALNRCGSCGHTWTPKGASLSPFCPNCNSTDTRYDIRKEHGVDAKEELSSVRQNGRKHSVGEGARTASLQQAPPPRFQPMGAPAHVAHPSQRADRARSSQADKRSRLVPVLVLFLVVATAVGGLVYWRMQPSAMSDTGDCKMILERLAFSKKKARSGNNRWHKWVKHWRIKALEAKCFEE